jgi:hypothetical protein
MVVSVAVVRASRHEFGGTDDHGFVRLSPELVIALRHGKTQTLPLFIVGRELKPRPVNFV